MATSARVFLQGYTQDDENGLGRQHYLDPSDEFYYRCVLATMLAEGLADRDICRALAGLIAPDGHELASDRRLEFVQRRRGRKKEAWPITQIADVVLDKVREGANVEEGIRAATEKFDISREYAYKCWVKLKPVYEAIGYLPTTRSRSEPK